MSDSGAPASVPAVPFRSALRAWVKVAAYSFGGPAGQIAVLHRVVVDERKWLTEDRFIHALSYCMLLPGPEAQQLATYVGWLLHGVRGGLAAGLLFILPGFVSILVLSIAYFAYREMGLVAAVFFGLKPAVAAIVAEAVVRLKRRALKGSLSTWVAATAFVAIFFFDIPFPLIVIGAAVAGLVGDRLGHRKAAAEPPARVAVPRLGPLIRTVLTWLVIWLAPVGVLLLVFGRGHVFVREAAFFSKVALVTFGGAYAVLAYVAQQAVDVYGWLTAGQMLDGLGLAETTPGPLIMVVQFVGFLGAAGSSGTMDPLLAGVVGSVVTTWVTFAPCFLFIFAGAPYVEWLRGHRALTAALGGVMAAVVGVVLNLAVWFALHVVFSEVASTRVGPARLWIPALTSIDLAAALIAAGALVAVLRYRLGMFTVLGAGAAAGVLYKLVLGG